MPSRLPLLLACLCALFVFSPGCALVTNGLHQQVAIESVPAGATVLVDGSEAGQTPLNVNLSRRSAHQLELRKAGFAPATRTVRAEPADYLRRPIRFGVDLDSGAANELAPAVVRVELAPEATATIADGDAFSQLTAALRTADDLWHQGSVSEADHRAMVEKILARYER